MHPIENMMKTTMEEIREMIDVNTIVGDPVHTSDGGVIIPISKVSFGFLAGGGEYGDGGSSREEDGDSTDNPFAGGGSAGISLNPMAFLVVNDNNVRLLPVNFNSTVDRIVDLIPQAVDMVRNGGKDKKDKKEKETTVTREIVTTIDGTNYDIDGSKLEN